MTFGRNIATLSHGIIKQGAGAPLREIDLAVQRKEAFEQNPTAHTYME